MRAEEHPFFVPFGPHHLAAVLTVPREDPAGLVLLAPGRWSPRSLRQPWWSVMARRLADELDLAALRLDYADTGDSSRHGAAWREDTAGQVDTALDLAARAAGVPVVAAVGSCLGARHALRLAADRPGIATAVAIHLTVSPQHLERAGARPSGRGRRLLHRIGGRRPDPNLRRWLSGAAGRSDVLILQGIPGTRWGGVELRILRALVDGLPPGRRERVRLELREDLRLAGLRSVEAQRVALEETMTTLARALGPRRARASEGTTRVPSSR